MSIKTLNAFTSLNIDLGELFALPDCHVYSKDGCGRYIQGNDAFLEFNEFKSYHDAIGVTDLEIPIWKPESAKLFMSNDQKVIRNNKSMFLQEFAIANNKSFCLLSIKTPLFDQNKKIIGILGISYDLNKVNSQNVSLFSEHILNSRKQLVDHSNFPKLTNRQIECLYYLAKGQSPKQIARLFNISTRTVEHHIENLKQKLKCYSRSDLIGKAYEIPDIKIRLLT